MITASTNIQPMIVASIEFPKPKFWFGDRVECGSDRGMVKGMDYYSETDEFDNPAPSAWYYHVRLDETCPDYEVQEGEDTFLEADLKLIAATLKHGRKFWK